MLAPTPDEVRYINTSQFPASYSINDGAKSTLDQLRIIVTDSHIVIYGDKEFLLDVHPIESFEKINGRQFKVVTKQGDTITIYRENNCGCGNQLRGWNPYMGKPHIAHYPSLKGT